LSDREGVAVLQIPEASTIASIAPDWIRAVKESGRFSEFDWTGTEDVVTGTLAAAIEKYGEPAFCKIDVEGNEAAVINGLDRALRALSLEFTPEHSDGLMRAIDRLGELGAYEWNFAPFDDGGDSARFELPEWVPTDAFSAFIRDYKRSDAGNVYARLAQSSGS
jgi:Methyltransferase FkbM domain